MAEGPAPTLEFLEARDDFVRRHIGPGDAQIAAMLEAVGADSLDALLDETVPSDIRLDRPLSLPPARSEREALHDLRGIAARNAVRTSMIGMGYYGTVTPPVILRNVLESPGWYTAYTPYQAEISQGRLEALLTFQQMTMDLTGFDLANASLLDEATAAAEAMAMARRVGKSKAATFFVDADTHPQTVAVLRTRAQTLGVEVTVGDPATLDPETVFAALLSYPGSSGAVRDWRGVIEALHGAGALAIMATDLLALTLLTPPGELGADVAIGSAQRFGVPMGYGGPHAAFFATRDAYKRSCPGRIIGVSVDSGGAPALRMALQTREQHIRRDKATSNICTAQALLAVLAAMYGVWHGPDGVTRIARRVARLTAIAAEGLTRLGYSLAHEAFFDTVTVRVPGRARRIAARALERRINLRVVDADTLGFSLDETTRRKDVETLWRCFGGAEAEALSVAALDGAVDHALPADLARETPFMEHPVFNLHHGETEMLRYLRRLQAKDIALDRAMIPLGSCTMKLNAASEMIPITWKSFANLHPFAPLEQTQGYQQLFEELEGWLAEITGFEAVSLQPNAGSQGEYAGLLCIRRWHESRGEGARDVCLVPSSAHGTNPASAVMAGHEGRGGGLRRARRHRPRRPARQGRGASRPAGGADGHLSLDPWRVRGRHPRGLRRGPRGWRAGLHGRRQPQRAGRRGAARRYRRRCLPHEPAQDLLHPPWRRRAGRRAHRRGGASGAVPARPSGGGGCEPGSGRVRRAAHGGRGGGGALGLGDDPADPLDLYRDDGAGGAAPRDGLRDFERQLHRHAAEGPFSRGLYRAERAGRA
jgi:glycine dehydrogenase